MKKIFTYLKRCLALIIGSVLIYLLFAFILSIWSTNPKKITCTQKQSIYLITNGVHLDIVLEKSQINTDFFSQLKDFNTSNYIAFGWGDKGFYLNTPEWADLKFGTVLNAMFLKSETVMHITRLDKKRNDFVKIDICETQLKKLVAFIEHSFQVDEYLKPIEIKGKGYSKQDDFYEATGSYNCIKTCNEWVNEALKVSEIKTSLWSPFDLGILYQVNRDNKN